MQRAGIRAKKQLVAKAEEELAELEEEIRKEEIKEAELEAKARFHPKCKYRKCGKKFATDDERRHYCCHEHYLAENRERTVEKNALRKKLIDT